MKRVVYKGPIEGRDLGCSWYYGRGRFQKIRLEKTAVFEHRPV